MIIKNSQRVMNLLSYRIYVDVMIDRNIAGREHMKNRQPFVALEDAKGKVKSV